MATKTFNKAKKNKADEFYTQFSDINNELCHYKKEFRDKVVFCNCDDPYESNFFKYFAMNFNHFGLKKLIATCYVGSPIANTQLSLFDDEPVENRTTKSPHKIEIVEVESRTGDREYYGLADVEYLLRNKKNVLTRLKGDGDFRSEECVELMKEADIVVTNPPFSLFREYVAQLIEHDKKFIIIGNKNAITYKEIFTLMQQEKMWLGYRSINADMWFVVPDNYDHEKVVDGQRVKHIMGCWFTNLETTKRHENMILYKQYTPEKYPRYVNYDAIEVSKVAEIPRDYEGAMGVPITFLDKYNPRQFKLIGSSLWLGEPMLNYAPKGSFVQGGNRFYLPKGDGTYERLYDRIVIKRIGATE